MSLFADVLQSSGPAGELSDRLDLYAFLVGHWQYDALYHLPGGGIRKTTGEIHAAWVLGGRAIQDVWIVPARNVARAQKPEPGDYWGTTLRIYDPTIDAWHIQWSDPLTQTYRRQLGRAVGAKIVQVGTDNHGVQSRWSFSDITGDAFRWTGERSVDGGANWILLADFAVRRD